VDLLQLLEGLKIYGPLGVMVIVFAAAAAYKDKQLTQERANCDNEKRAMQDKHEAEMKTLTERYIAKADTWVAKYQDLGEAQDATNKALRGLVDEYRGKNS
jgi:hypothetical protein